MSHCAWWPLSVVREQEAGSGEGGQRLWKRGQPALAWCGEGTTPVHSEVPLFVVYGEKKRELEGGIFGKVSL